MKKYNYILIMVMAFAMTLASCSQKEDIGSDIKKTAEVEISISKAELLKSGALNNGEGVDVDEIIYCDEGILATDGVVKLKYDVDFDKGDDIVGAEVEFTYDSDAVEAEKGISKLIQFDFLDGATTATVTVTSAYILGYNDDPETTEVVEGQEFVAPVAGSPFADYVEHPIGKAWTVNLYEKTYVKVEVLCFKQQAVALFGYSWFDFEILTGEEVCVFFNCLGTTSETYHQVFAASFDAYIIEDDNTDGDLYWSGANYTKLGVPAEIEPICIPCPGNYAEKGFRIYVTPMGYEHPVTSIDVSPADIDAFLQGTMPYTASGDDYELEMAKADGVPFLHYTMEDCYKSKAIVSVVNESPDLVSGIYGVNFSDDANPTKPIVSKMFDVPGYSAHIALTPDETKLIIGNSRDAKDLMVYDIYTLKTTTLVGDASVEERAGMYYFVQMVYMEDQLYAGCMKNECLVPINFDLEDGTFSFGPDLKDFDITNYDPEAEDVEGGDLLAAHVNNLENGDPSVYHNLFSFSKWDGGALIRYSQNWGNTSEMEMRSEYVTLSDLNNVNGACLIEGVPGVEAITSYNDGKVLVLKTWDSNIIATGPEFSKLSETYTYDIVSGKGGDMASGYNPNWWTNRVSDIFFDDLARAQYEGKQDSWEVWNP